MPSPQSAQGPSRMHPSQPHKIRCSHAKLPRAGWGRTASSELRGGRQGEVELRAPRYEGRAADPDTANRTTSNLQLSLFHKYILSASNTRQCPGIMDTAVDRAKIPAFMELMF